MNVVFDELMKLLIKHEAIRLKPYRCSAGKLTIGIGRNIEDQGISKIEALAMCVNDMERVQKEALSNLKFYNDLNNARKVVILNMLFNLGLSKFFQFKKFLAAVETKDFKKAAEEMLDSLWASQVGSRAVELADMMETGQLIEIRLN